MIKLLIWGLLIYIGYRIVISITASKKPCVSTHDFRDEATATHRDPICGLYVSEEDAVIGNLSGQRHYFCSRSCLEKFQERIEHPSS